MQHLRSFFWFLLTALTILGLTAFPLMSVGSQISVALPPYKRLISKCSFLLETCPLFNSNKNKMHMEQIYIH